MTFPFYHRFIELSKEAKQLWPSNAEAGVYDPGFGYVGLIGVDEEPCSLHYSCTPTNALTFAWTGGDGVHFSFVLQEGRITFESPIIQTCPANLGESTIVGEDLYNFLCLGCLRGYFCFGALGSERGIEALSDPNYTCKSDEDAWFGFGSDPIKEEILQFMRSELALQPWQDAVNKLERLQVEYAGQLVYPDDYPY